MKNIGVVLPSSSGRGNFFKRIFRKIKYENFSIEEYGLNFVVAREDCNCSKIFNKNKIKEIVVMSDCEIERCDFKILNGESAFKKLLPSYVRKLAKSFGDGCSVTVVDKGMCADTAGITDELCNICKTVTLVTRCRNKAEFLAEKLLGKYGIVINVSDDDSIICSDIAVVIKDCDNSYSSECTVIDMNLKVTSERRISDFYIPFRVKPPFGMSNLVFAECLDTIDKKIVDIR